MRRAPHFDSGALPLLVVKLLDWKRDEKGTRRGWADLRIINCALTVKRAAIHRFDSANETRLWLTMPLSSYIGGDGRTYSTPTFFFSRPVLEQITDQVLDQLRKLDPEVFAPKKERAA